MLKSARLCRNRFSIYKRTCVSLKSTSASARATLSSAELAEAEMATALRFPFASAKVGSFAQEPPQLDNQYTQDSLLRSFLTRHVPAEVREVYVIPQRLRVSMAQTSSVHSGLSVLTHITLTDN